MGHGASIMHHLTMGRPYFFQAIVQSPALIPSPNRTRLDQTYNHFLTLMGAKDLEELFNANTTGLMQANADIVFSKLRRTKCMSRPSLTFILLQTLAMGPPHSARLLMAILSNNCLVRL
jgi:hypothetical protein